MWHSTVRSGDGVIALTVGRLHELQLVRFAGRRAGLDAGHASIGCPSGWLTFGPLTCTWSAGRRQSPRGPPAGGGRGCGGRTPAVLMACHDSAWGGDGSVRRRVGLASAVERGRTVSEIAGVEPRRGLVHIATELNARCQTI